MTDSDLDERIASLTKDVRPERDLWPELRAALPPRTHASSRGWLQMAAAVVLFAAGLLAGRYFDLQGPRIERSSPTALAAAAEVQRAGAAYVRALADLRETRATLPPAIVGQGRDAAIATMEAAAWELKKLGPSDETAAEIFALARSAREEVAQ